MESIIQFTKENPIIPAIIGFVIVFILAYWVLGKLFFSKNENSKGGKNNSDSRGGGDILDRYEGDLEEDDLPPDDFSDIKDPRILQLAHKNFLKDEEQISDSVVEGGIIQFKNNNAEKLKLLQESEEENKRSLERIKKSSFNK
jgi:hypothetical protein